MTDAIATITPQSPVLPAMTMADATASAEGWKAAAHQWGKIIETGWLPEAVKTHMQAMAIVEHGRCMGLDPWESLRSVAMVKGTPTLKAATLGGLIRKRYGPRSFVVMQSDDKACRIKVSAIDPETGKGIFPIVEFTIEDAKRAGLTGGNWGKYPASMLYARAISRVEKRHLNLIDGGEVWISELLIDKAAPAPKTLGDL